MKCDFSRGPVPATPIILKMDVVGVVPTAVSKRDECPNQLVKLIAVAEENIDAQKPA